MADVSKLKEHAMESMKHWGDDGTDPRMLRMVKMFENKDEMTGALKLAELIGISIHADKSDATEGQKAIATINMLDHMVAYIIMEMVKDMEKPRIITVGG